MVVTASCSFTIWSLDVFGINVFSLVHNFTRHYLDDLQVLTTIYTLLVSCPLYSFVVLCLDEHRNIKYGKSSLFWWVSLFVSRDSRLITFNVRRYSRQVIATFSLCIGCMCKLSSCFPRIDFASLF